MTVAASTPPTNRSAQTAQPKHTRPTRLRPSAAPAKAAGRSRSPEGASAAWARAARAAGLRYASDDTPGITRRRSGRGFCYYGPDGEKITDAQTLARIRSLAIPPAWKDVWISTAPRGHLQATGRDAKGRKQYRYHPLWRAVRDEAKYDHLLAFGEALPTIRAQVARDLARRGSSREKALATIVELLDMTAIRIGNEEYARENASYGLTTLRTEHVSVRGERVRFQFRGKSGKPHTVDIRDRRLARIIKDAMDLPGDDLFQYLDDEGQPRGVTSDDVNEYLQSITGEHITAKDFRTWEATLCVASALATVEPPPSKAQAKRAISQAMKEASQRLGNTPTICRNSYVHPQVIDAYLDQRLAPLWQSEGASASPSPASGATPNAPRALGAPAELDDNAPPRPDTQSSPLLDDDERRLLTFLRSLESDAPVAARA